MRMGRCCSRSALQADNSHFPYSCPTTLLHPTPPLIFSPHYVENFKKADKVWLLLELKKLTISLWYIKQDFLTLLVSPINKKVRQSKWTLLSLLSFHRLCTSGKAFTGRSQPTASQGKKRISSGRFWPTALCKVRRGGQEVYCSSVFFYILFCPWPVSF